MADNMGKTTLPMPSVELDEGIDREEELQTRVAWHYYVGNMTQQEIAQLLGTNRVRVNRLLAASRESGLVRITIDSRIAPCVALEEQLVERFGLQAAVVVPTGATYEATMAALGIGAANYLIEHIAAGHTIGLGWGRTIRAVLRAIPQRAYGPLSAVSLQGGLAHCPSINTFDIVSDFADLCHADGYLFPAPIYVSSQKVRDVILQEDAVRETYELARGADLALLTAGDLTESLVITYGVKDPEDLRTLRKAGAVGDVLGHFVDENGKLINHPLNRRTVAVALEDLHAIKCVVLASGGAQKFFVTRAALRGGYVSVLVTDEDTARRLCAEP
jgi:DNA-binding transcriptional regulator LsrR (DeoR family)